MKLARCPLLSLVALLAAFNMLAATNEFDPPAIYLQWQRDPSSTMTIHWHTVGVDETRLLWRKAGAMDWNEATGVSRPFTGTDRTVHVVELAGLAEDALHEFCFKPDAQIYKFRTMPAKLDRPVRFISGGDIYHKLEWMGTMNALAARQSPDFVVLGGDLAYSCGGTNVEKKTRWFDYYASWKTNAVTPDGRLIPMLVTLGNHEVVGSYRQPSTRAEGFHDVFSSPGTIGYQALDFGDYLSLLLLDSDHTATIEGEQTRWLGGQLESRRRVPHVIPVYHTPGYPGHREFTGTNALQAIRVRAHWSPLFDKYGVKLVFENHDHVFKRTHPIRANQIDPTGTVYLGDGAWGVELRKAGETPRWYLASAGGIRHFFVVTLYKEGRHVVALNDKGEVFDELYQRVK